MACIVTTCACLTPKASSSTSSGKTTPVVEQFGPDQLLARKTYQDRYDETGLGAVLHVMEHFSGHAGQIYAFTKQVKNVDLRFYDL